MSPGRRINTLRDARDRTKRPGHRRRHRSHNPLGHSSDEAGETLFLRALCRAVNQAGNPRLHGLIEDLSISIIVGGEGQREGGRERGQVVCQVQCLEFVSSALVQKSADRRRRKPHRGGEGGLEQRVVRHNLCPRTTPAAGTPRHGRTQLLKEKLVPAIVAVHALFLSTPACVPTLPGTPFPEKKKD